MSLVRTKNNVFPNFFQDFLEDNTVKQRTDTGRTVPFVNVKSFDTHYLIQLAVPGMSKDKFEIEIERNVLSISSHTEEEEKERKDYTLREFNFSSFTRSFNLPNHAIKDKITAQYKEGVLEVVIPKEGERPSKKVKIN